MKNILTILLLAWATPNAWGQGAFLGVELSPSQASSGGAEIASVQSPSAASIMGLQAGDLVTGLDELRIASGPELVSAIAQRLPGEIVTVHVMRGAETLALPGVLGRHPQARAPQSSWQLAPAEPRDLAPWMPTPFPQLPRMEWRMPDFWGQDSPWSRERPERLGFDLLGSDWMEPFQSWWDSPFGADGQLMPPTFDQEGMQQSVRIRYPESTSTEERERLMREAEEKYGPEVQVDFQGVGTSISIQSTTQQRWEAAPTEPLDPRRSAEDDEI